MNMTAPWCEAQVLEADTFHFQNDPYHLVRANFSSRFFGHDSGVNRPYTGEPSAGVSNQKAYDYSSFLMKDTSTGEYRLYTQGRYRARIGGIGSFGGTVTDGDHVFLHTSPTGLGYTWVNQHPSQFNPEPKPAPLFLQGKFSGEPNRWYSGNYNDPEVLKVGGVYYMYTQVEIRPGDPLDTGHVAQNYWADRVQLHTSSDGINFTRFADRSVFVNIPDPVAYDIGHHEVMYVPWDDSGRPFWMYTRYFLNGVFSGHVRIRSNDPYTFDWSAAEVPQGMIGIGQQVGYIPNVGGAPLYARITGLEAPDGRWVPTMQFSRDGLTWLMSSGEPMYLAGSTTDDPRFRLLFYFGMSTLDGTGEWEEIRPGMYRVVYAATAGNTESIFDSEIGVGEMFVTFTFEIPGDYNRDGKVGAADYVLWRKRLGSFGLNLPADGNKNNIIDQGDYYVWRDNFGKSLQGSATSLELPSATAIPEPGSSIALALCACLLLYTCCGGRRRLLGARVCKAIDRVSLFSLIGLAGSALPRHRVLPAKKVMVAIGAAALTCCPNRAVCNAQESNKNITEVTFNGLTIVFDGETGSILRMSHPDVGVFLETARDTASLIDLAYPLPIFEALRLSSRWSENAMIHVLRDRVDITWERLGASRNIDEAGCEIGGYKLTYSENSKEYSWSRLGAADFDTGGPVIGKVSISAASNGKSVIFKCYIENQSKHPVRQVLFPDLVGLIPIEGNEETSFRGGGVNIQPFTALQRVENGAVFWPELPSMNGLEFKPGGYYVTNKLLTQYFDYGNLMAGFSLFRKRWGWEQSDDPWIPSRSVWLRRDEATGSLRISWATRLPEIRPGEQWESAEYWLTPSGGGWARRIEPYREWVRSNVHREHPVPRHVKEGLGFRTIWMAHAGFPGDPCPDRFTNWKFTDLPAVAKEAKDHGLDELVVWNWSQGGQLPVPPPFPQCGTAEELTNAIQECERIGVNVSLFVSLWSLAHPSAERYGLKLPESGGWTYHPELLPAFNPYYSTVFASAAADIGQETWRQDVLRSCRQIIDRYSASLVWDQFVGLPVEPDIYSLTKQIRRFAIEKNPNSTFAAESLTSIETDAAYLDYTWDWTSYGDLGDLHAFTSVFPAPRVNINIDKSAADVKHSFMDNLYLNVMPRREGGTNGSARISEFPELSSALKQCARLRQEFLPYFCEGVLIGNCILQQPVPNTHVVAYVLPHRILVMALNEASETRDVALACDLQSWITADSHSLVVKMWDERGEHMSTEPLDLQHSVLHAQRLGSGELALWEICSLD